jgi:hypothetical protein
MLSVDRLVTYLLTIIANYAAMVATKARISSVAALVSWL